jgi:3-oxoisoapionate decarboxylase
VKLGISSWTYPWRVGVLGRQAAGGMTAAALLECAIAKGIGLVQYCENLPIQAETPARRRALRERAEGAGVEIQLGTRGVAANHLEGQLRLCEEMGAHLLRTVIEPLDGVQPCRDEVIAMLNGQLERFAGAGVELAVENHELYSADDLAQIVEALDSRWVGICLDTANSLGRMEGPGVVVPRLAPHTLCLHAKDVRVARVPTMLGFTVTGAPAGEGDLDLPGLLRLVREAGRCGSVVLEQWPPDLGDPNASGRQETEWAERGIAYLRGLIEE